MNNWREKCGWYAVSKNSKKTTHQSFMDNLFIFIFLFPFLFLSASATPAALTQPLPIPPPQQIGNIIDALIGAGDFTGWVGILSMANPLVLPLSATLFVPQDGRDFISDHPVMDPLLFPYHVVPQRLSFSDLLLFKPHTRLPTLLPAMSISITNNSRSNFTLDDTLVTHPDLYATDAVAVHGVAAILDYSVFGNSFPLLPSPTTGDTSSSPPPPPSIGDSIGWRSDSACSCTEVPIVFLIFCVVLALKLQRNPISSVMHFPLGTLIGLTLKKRDYKDCCVHLTLTSWFLHKKMNFQFHRSWSNIYCLCTVETTIEASMDRCDEELWRYNAAVIDVTTIAEGICFLIAPSNAVAWLPDSEATLASESGLQVNLLNTGRKFSIFPKIFLQKRAGWNPGRWRDYPTYAMRFSLGTYLCYVTKGVLKLLIRIRKLK
ncbi:FAS1 domain-containing protein [Senna tora]|uniref:FAS1 domain-containing protein n=1 Tax=Senna tora TaxID=362788 RepID=A0A834SI84_9FABA|nr:FAS1 domain-containing protein [Senna tora]